MRTAIVAAIGLVVCSGVPAHAQDVEGGSDHPLVPRIVGSDLITYNFTEFDRVTLPFGAYEGDGEWEDSRTIEGEHTKLSYILRQPEVSTLQVKRAYIQGLEDNGFEIEFRGSGRSDLGRRFSRQDIFDRPRVGNDLRRARRGSDRNPRFIAASQADGTLAVTAYMYQNRELEPVIKVNIVEETVSELEMEVGAAAPAGDAAEEADLELETETRAETEAADGAARESLTSAELEDSIVEAGRVAVQDILFEFDSDQILPESADALETIAELMHDNPDLELLVVGHTDSVGQFDYNLDLSLDRANAVSIWLQLEQGVSGDRLQAAGAGMMAPIASNRTEDGRALNRRVELVEIVD